MKTVLKRDVPVGALCVVLALWCFSIVYYLTNYADTFTLIGIIVASVYGNRLLSVGIDVIIGIRTEEKND